MHIIPFYFQNLTKLKAEYAFFAPLASIAHITCGYSVKFVAGRHKEISKVGNVNVTQKRTGDIRIFQSYHNTEQQITMPAENASSILHPFAQDDINESKYNEFMRQNKKTIHSRRCIYI